jgi:hypothetical protein
MSMKVKFVIVFAAMMVVSGSMIAETEKTLKPLPKDCSRQFLAAWNRFLNRLNARPEGAGYHRSQKYEGNDRNSV